MSSGYRSVRNRREVLGLYRKPAPPTTEQCFTWSARPEGLFDALVFALRSRFSK